MSKSLGFFNSLNMEDLADGQSGGSSSTSGNGYQQPRGRGGRNKKNPRDGEKARKNSGGRTGSTKSSKENSPVFREFHNEKVEAPLPAAEMAGKNEQAEVFSTNAHSNWDTTNDEPFVTANNSAAEPLLNGSNNNGNVFDPIHMGDTFEDDLKNSNVETELSSATLSESPLSVISVEKDNELQDLKAEKSMDNEEDEESELADASMVVQLSNTILDTTARFGSISSTDTSLSASPSSSSRNAPPDFSTSQNISNSAVYAYPANEVKFQTSTPIPVVESAGKSRRNGVESNDSEIVKINMMAHDEEPSGGWESTIYPDDGSTLARGNRAFRVDPNDTTQPSQVEFGLTTKESGICDMSTGESIRNDANSDAVVEEPLEEILVISNEIAKAPTEVPTTAKSDTKPEVDARLSSYLQRPTIESGSGSDADDEVEQINEPFLLPRTVTELIADNGIKVYLIGTAHFSRQSQQDVIQTVQNVRPSDVVLELCRSRSGMLNMNEEQIMAEAESINFKKFRRAIRDSGVVQGCLHLLLLRMTAELTQKLGMPPGGEFRVAVGEASKIPGCTVHLGDRNLSITLNRALGGLGFFQKLKFAWHLVRASDASITPEEVEACKDKDLLEKLLIEMAAEFPSITAVLLDERDLYLAHSLWLAATSPRMDRMGGTRKIEGPVVGVVGMGHVPGIVRNWGRVSEDKIRQITIIPDSPASSRIGFKIIRISFYALLGFGAWKCSRAVFNFPSNELIHTIVGKTEVALQRLGRK